MKKHIINISVTFITILLLWGTLECILRVRDGWLMENELKSLIKDKEITGKTFNIYYFGGSTMVGEPWDPSLSIPKLVDYMLDSKVQGREARYVNIAQDGQDFKFNLDRLRIILKKKRIFHPSLCFIYSGHNEFVKFHGVCRLGKIRVNNIGAINFIFNNSLVAREIVGKIIHGTGLKANIWTLEIDERDLFDQPLFEKNKYKETIETYKAQITDAIKLFHRYNVPCIISTVAGNYADWEPNRSIWSANDADKEEYKKLMSSGREAQDQGKFDKAISYYLEALSLCENFAETHYRLGKCYELQKDYAKAWEHYNKAVDYDGMPLRAMEEQNDFIRKLRENNIVFTVDSVEYLRKNTEHGIIGFNLMMDAHHPNLSGYILISHLIAEKINKIFHGTKKTRSITEQEAKRVFNIDNSKMFEVFISRGRWFSRIATWRYDPLERLLGAERYFLNAKAIDASRYEPYLGLAMCYFLRKDTDKAGAYLSQAQTINRDDVNTYLKEYWVQQVIDRAYKN